MGEAYRAHGRHEKCIQRFRPKTEGKRSLGRYGHKWEDIELDLEEVG